MSTTKNGDPRNLGTDAKIILLYEEAVARVVNQHPEAQRQLILEMREILASKLNSTGRNYIGRQLVRLGEKWVEKLPPNLPPPIPEPPKFVAPQSYISLPPTAFPVLPPQPPPLSPPPPPPIITTPTPNPRRRRVTPTPPLSTIPPPMPPSMPPPMPPVAYVDERVIATTAVKNTARVALEAWVRQKREPINNTFYDVPFLSPILPPGFSNVMLMDARNPLSMYIQLPNLWFWDPEGMHIRTGEVDDGRVYKKDLHRALGDADPRQLRDENGRIMKVDLTYRDIPSLGPEERAAMRLLPCTNGLRVRYWLHHKSHTDVPGWGWFGVVRNNQLVQISQEEYNNPTLFQNC